MVEQTRDQDFDTIAAIATAPGLAGIGIVRISGPDALRIADELFEGTRKPSHMQGFEAAYGWVKAKGERIDEAIVLVMRGPKSYTRQDVVEFQCHGGSVVLLLLAVPWVRVLGTSLVTLKGVAILWSTLTLCAFVAVGWRYFSPRVGLLWGVLYFALSPTAARLNVTLVGSHPAAMQSLELMVLLAM